MDKKLLRQNSSILKTIRISHNKFIEWNSLQNIMWMITDKSKSTVRTETVER